MGKPKPKRKGGSAVRASPCSAGAHTAFNILTAFWVRHCAQKIKKPPKTAVFYLFSFLKRLFLFVDVPKCRPLVVPLSSLCRPFGIYTLSFVMS